MKSDDVYRRLREAFGDPIGSYAGDAPVGVRSESVCGGCGMPTDSCACPESGVCAVCGEMPIGGQCSCTGISLMEAAGTCAECGMYEVEGSCGCTHEHEIEEVAPPGKEKMVKALKKDPNIDNPWAVAWAAHNKEKRK